MYSGPGIFVLGIVVILLAVSTNSVYKRNERAVRELRDAEARRDQLEARVAELEKKKAVVETVGLEEEIRSRFSLVKPGERMIILSGSAATSDPAVSTKKASGFLDTIRSMIGW